AGENERYEQRRAATGLPRKSHYTYRAEVALRRREFWGAYASRVLVGKSGRRFASVAAAWRRNRLFNASHLRVFAVRKNCVIARTRSPARSPQRIRPVADETRAPQKLIACEIVLFAQNDAVLFGPIACFAHTTAIHFAKAISAGRLRLPDG